MNLIYKITIIMVLITVATPAFCQEYLGKSKQEIGELFVEGEEHVVKVEQTEEGLRVIQDKRDQRNMKHRVTYSFLIEKGIVNTYTIIYPCNSFMEEEVSMFLDMNDEKQAISEESIEINGNGYKSSYNWDKNIKLFVGKGSDNISLRFSH